MIIVDGNDGTGKSTLVASLQAQGITAADRGFPTKMTDDPNLMPDASDQNRYILVDVPVEISRLRLANAGKDLDEKYHTVADLTYYRAQYTLVRERLQSVLSSRQVGWFDGTKSREVLLQEVLDFLRT